jgi:hypothetical protein
MFQTEVVKENKPPISRTIHFLQFIQNGYTRHNTSNYTSPQDTWALRRGHIPKTELTDGKHKQFHQQFQRHLKMTNIG